MKIHIVQKGDTLWKIAQKYGVNFEQLKSMNTHLSNPDMIMPGMKIKIPNTGGTIKKEAPSYKKEMPTKKEYPKVEHPFKEMKPPTIPVEKEQPIGEMPKEKIKEVPKPIFMPKYPQPIHPEIDINNYYMVNMAKMQIDQTEPMMPPQMPPQMPPIKEMPEVDEEIPEMEESIETEEMPEQPAYYPQMMYPSIPCVPVTPVLPGTGIPCYPMPMGHMPMFMQPMTMSPSPEQMAMMVDPTGTSSPSYMDGAESMEEMPSEESPYNQQVSPQISPPMFMPYVPSPPIGMMGPGMMCGNWQPMGPSSNLSQTTDPMQYYPSMPMGNMGGNWAPGWQTVPVGENWMNYGPWMMSPMAQVPSMGYQPMDSGYFTSDMNQRNEDDE
ncbi:LysM peptidoglycan-binding domain-containing protein [Fervidibacillus halotolerans]|uniref:SafA/ExsA family spore coat assembly protein n=1 Tax=Fervidibacillus halotolerans TaxID=2980027 RepID=A0A9E8LXN5_9BACI|nr:SafA/ExsA family spore coat assembly protein [Fervidibacillus halotolerans]WAA11575.1 SafA/ExsA family spore coat assembly protein [Fervidibacillus halotolerans]